MIFCSFGQLGLGVYKKSGRCNLTESVATPVPVPVNSSGKILHVACGGGHSLIVNEEGVIMSCGSNSCGQLGLGNEDDVDVFTSIPFFTHMELNPLEVAFVACGEEYSACITRHRQVYTWGLGNVGQIGNGDFRNVNAPYHVEELEDKQVEGLTCSQSQVFAICSNGQVFNW